MNNIDRRQFNKYISGFALSPFILQNFKSSNYEFDLEKELPNIANKLNYIINNSFIFNLFNVEYIENGSLGSLDLNIKCDYIPNHGYLAKTGKLLDSWFYHLRTAIDWNKSIKQNLIENNIEIFLQNFIDKLNIDAFNLLKYIGKNNKDRLDLNNSSIMVGNKYAINQFKSLFPNMSNIDFRKVESLYALNNNEFIVLNPNINYLQNLHIQIREKPILFEDMTIRKMRKEGFYGFTELRFINTDPNIAHYINLENYSG